VAFLTKIYCKFTVECAVKNLRPGKKADCLTHSVCLGTVLLKDEEIAIYLVYGCC